METTFPLSAFEWEKDFAAAVEVAIPFGIFLIREVCPYVVVYAFEPFHTFRIARQLIALEHRDERFDVYPPKLLVPFQLLARTAEAIHEVEDAAVVLVPSVFCFVDGDFHRFFNQFRTVEALSEVHDEPHGFDGMARIEQTSVEAVDELAVGAEMLDDESEFGAIEHVHHFVDAGVDGALQEIRFEERFDFESDVAKNHGQGEALERAGTGSRLVPFTLRVFNL